MKITLEIELLSPGKWGLDMSRVYIDASNMPVNVIYAHGEDLSEGSVHLRIARGVEKIISELEGGGQVEFVRASMGPEEL